MKGKKNTKFQGYDVCMHDACAIQYYYYFNYFQQIAGHKHGRVFIYFIAQ